jgi:hypothetical protein
MGKKEKVVFRTGCLVAPRFRDTCDLSRVSLIETVSFRLKSRPPFLLTTSDIGFKTRELTLLRDEFFVFRTAKDHLTIEVMKFYMNSIFGPSVKSLHGQFSDQRPNVFFIADNRVTQIDRICNCQNLTKGTQSSKPKTSTSNKRTM